ncbi:fatty acid cis/trans isomerase [Thiohalobacter sp. IOR34]|uniref:fatty acid cis/trans isomerase n=1 Tax=Thiohalobacter sp. IOR34 TaxID=3057176 RepID=UPI0025B1BA2A|nr:fatty acid cis/trans isomerase [Thiohalobacter sp. IOR34]WJW75870.1 fatty acid cis/trans isomerase [Thiohalobacter sp. IOR34]
MTKPPPFLRRKKRTATLLALLLLSLLLFHNLSGPSLTMGTATPLASPPLPDLADTPVDFETRVRPILEKRCVVCHGCYDAPCQLKLSSIEGLRRGASKARVYDATRLRPAPPSRLFVDAQTTEEWRRRGFFPVLNEGPATAEDNLGNSLLYRLLQLKQQHPQPRTGRLPDSFTLGLDREQSCPTLETVDDFARRHPMWGMPYAMPNLTDQEYRTLVAWLAQGAPAPPPAAPSAAARPQIRSWETFLNQPSRKQRLVSRYLYEHLFHAHIHFAGTPAREFYRLVRSTTPPGEPIVEIATARPFDDPGQAAFYYRLRRYPPSIVAKNHAVYELSGQRMARYRQLFLAPDYRVERPLSYEPQLTSNPFKIFAEIPAESRYRFLLDDAHFFIEGFVKGPVCRGQIALSVIEDQFWVLFFDPDRPLLTNSTRFVGTLADELETPAGKVGDLDLLGIWTDYWQRQRRYMASKQAWFENLGTHDLDHAVGYIWDGEGQNPNAALTVFRHFDSGSVAYGLVGSEPETAWIIDYPLFERIHYLLVGGYDVYGNLVHQLNTRIYMDFLRMEGEDNFLAFLPAERRKAIRDSWYVGQRSGIEKLFSGPQDWLRVDAVRGYRSDDPQHELYQRLRQRLAGIEQPARAMNRCGGTGCLTQATDSEEAQADRAMAAIARLRGAKLHAFPDIAFVRVRMEKAKEDLAYTLIRNKAYQNVTSFLADESERNRADIERDTMSVVKWLESSYPNFFFSVALSEIDDFTRRCAAIRNRQDYQRFVDRYGVRRTDPAFWELADWFQERYARTHPRRSGLFDLNRYQNL